MGFAEAISNMAPTWLKGRISGKLAGSKLLTVFGVSVDAMAEHLFQGIFVRMPGKGTLSALYLIGRDRGILRGIDEAPLAYAARMIPWLVHHRVRGNPFALMEQLRGYCNAPVRIRTVDANGNWFTWERDGSSSFLMQQGNWDWDGMPPDPNWSRFWVIIYPTADGLPWRQTQEDIGDAELWDIGAPGATIGTTATPGQVADVRALVDYWKGVGVCGIPRKCGGIVIAFDDESFDPTASPGAPGVPDGGWADHLTRMDDPRDPARLETAEYWRGT